MDGSVRLIGRTKARRRRWEGAVEATARKLEPGSAARAARSSHAAGCGRLERLRRRVEQPIVRAVDAHALEDHDGARARSVPSKDAAAGGHRAKLGDRQVGEAARASVRRQRIRTSGRVAVARRARPCIRASAPGTGPEALVADGSTSAVVALRPRTTARERTGRPESGGAVRRGHQRRGARVDPVHAGGGHWLLLIRLPARVDASREPLAACRVHVRSLGGGRIARAVNDHVGALACPERGDNGQRKKSRHSTAESEACAKARGARW